MSQYKVCHQLENVTVYGLSPVGECLSVRFFINRKMSQCKVCHQWENVSV